MIGVYKQYKINRYRNESTKQNLLNIPIDTYLRSSTHFNYGNQNLVRSSPSTTLESFLCFVFFILRSRIRGWLFRGRIGLLNPRLDVFLSQVFNSCTPTNQQQRKQTNE